MKILNLMNDDKQYPGFNEKTLSILSKMPPKPILTPRLVHLVETDKHFVEIREDEGNSFAQLRGCTLITKAGDHCPDLNFGGFVELNEILDHIKTNVS
jgi:hypothetical protein